MSICKSCVRNLGKVIEILAEEELPSHFQESGTGSRVPSVLGREVKLGKKKDKQGYLKEK